MALDNANELRQFITQIEAANAELETIQTDKAELFKAAKGAGFDPAIIRRVIAERRKNPTERAEQDALFRLYWDAVNVSLAQAREAAHDEAA
jgi:uncharacterized protein (UPF0335 family)